MDIAEQRETDMEIEVERGTCGEREGECTEAERVEVEGGRAL